MNLDYNSVVKLRGFDSTQYKLSMNVANNSLWQKLIGFQVDPDKALLLNKIGVYSSDGTAWGLIYFRLSINQNTHETYGNISDQIGDIFQPQEIIPVYIPQGSLVELYLKNASAVANPLLGMRIMGNFIRQLY